MSNPLFLNRLHQALGNRGIRSTTAQQTLNVRLFNREQTITKLSVCCQPQTVTVKAEWPADRSDESHATWTVDEPILCSRGAGVSIGNGRQVEPISRSITEIISSAVSTLLRSQIP